MRSRRSLSAGCPAGLYERVAAKFAPGELGHLILAITAINA